MEVVTAAFLQIRYAIHHSVSVGVKGFKVIFVRICSLLVGGDIDILE
jgi:hypothetical protein